MVDALKARLGDLSEADRRSLAAAGPVTVVVPYSPSGNTDVFMRHLAPYLEKAWGQPVLIDNRPGGGSMVGTAQVAQARPDGQTLLVTTSAYVTAPAIQPDLPFDPNDYGIEQRLYPSKDGTMIPLTILRKRALADSATAAPTILYGYGGFNISLTPGYSATRMAWLEQGGVYAIANLRGGGEYGKAWHDAGRGANKQNVFDDFIAAAEYLKANGFTPPDGLAIEGRSNGGLLVGAVVNQRPDLFAAALPAVGVMDMLRFDRFTADVDAYNSVALDLATAEDVPVNDLHAVIESADRTHLLQEDGVHFSEEGSRLLGDAVAEFVGPLIAHP